MPHSASPPRQGRASSRSQPRKLHGSQPAGYPQACGSPQHWLRRSRKEQSPASEEAAGRLQVQRPLPRPRSAEPRPRQVNPLRAALRTAMAFKAAARAAKAPVPLLLRPDTHAEAIRVVKEYQGIKIHILK